MKKITLGKFALCMSVMVSANQAELCRSQALVGLKVGGASAMLIRLGPPTETGNYKGLSLQRWNLSNGNELSVTVNKEGKIVYLESDWDGKSDDAGCDLPELHFGLTTLSELRKRFGSNGFGFKGRDPAVKTPDGLVMMNSFEVDTLVITFYTKINGDEFQRLKASGANPSPADYAKLDAISIADDAYAKSEWGDRVYDPAYKKIEWK
jgi:hypothetical protein